METYNNPKEFCKAVFGNLDNVVATLHDGGWKTYFIKGRKTFNGAWYTCVGRIVDQEDYVRRGRDEVIDVACLVLDDIGTKVDAGRIKVKPTWKMETSKGNYQYGYVLDEPCEKYRFETIVNGFIDAELTDPGASGCYRVVRLPGSLHKTGFRAKLTWLGGTHSIEDLARVHEITPREGARARETKASFRSESIDTLFMWMQEHGVIDTGGDFVELTCPNAAEHTSEGTTGGYSPLGRGPGMYALQRAFKCLHAHCVDVGFAELLASLDGAPQVPKYDPLPWLQQHYVIVANGRSRGAAYDIADLRYRSNNTDWYYSPPQVSAILGFHRRLSVPGYTTPVLAGTALAASEETKRYAGYTYRPGEEVDIVGERLWLNTYVPIDHPDEGDCTQFLEHVEHLVPDEEERETFLDWLAYKIQNPGGRTYSVMMVTDGVQGVGRSTLGDVMTAVWKDQGAHVTFDQLLGKGDSQSETWNTWMSGAQFVVVDEAKDSSDPYKAYETFKTRVDTKVGDVLIRRKGKDDEEEKAYFVTLIFSNHRDAFIIDEKDRRLQIIANPPVPLDPMVGKARYEYIMEHEIGAIFWMLKRRDLSRFESSVAPESDAKDDMAEMSISPWAAVKARLIEDAKGELIAKDDFEIAWRQACEDENATDDVKRAVRSEWLKLHRISKQKGGHKMEFQGAGVRVRALKNHAIWAKREPAQWRMEAAKNRAVSKLGGFRPK